MTESMRPVKSRNLRPGDLLAAVVMVLVVLTDAGCNREGKSQESVGNAAAASQDSSSSARGQRDSLQQMRLDSLLGRLDRTYDRTPGELMANFGVPLSAETLATKNIHTGERDFIYRYRFKGVAVALYHATGLRRYLLGSVDAESFPELSSLGILPGIRPDSVRHLFGPEDSTVVLGDTATQLQYAIGDIAESFALFIFRSDSLRLVSYRPYLD